ncbi:MAG: cytidylate kinase-like family protein [Magnetococcales bacterium]|nr:cytidylate kinase-like family protein [Magnetococcales bacterium]
MEQPNSQEVIQTLVNAELYSETHTPNKKNHGQKPLVTISRSFGCNGTEIAAIVAEKLGVQIYNKTLLKEVARTAKTDAELMARLDERVTTMIEDILASVMLNKNASKDYFYRAMVKVILSISHTGGVIVGRGAHLILANHPVFRVRLEGSIPVTTRNIAERNNLDPKSAERLVAQINKERTDFVRKMFTRFNSNSNDLGNKTFYDFQLNTDLFPPEQAADLIILAMKTAGFSTTS